MSDSHGAPRVALVTGGAKGIGAAISKRLAASGHRVVVNYLQSADEAERVVADITATGGQAIALRADVSRATEAAALIDQAADTWAHPSILVNNAGYSSLSTASKQRPEQWDRIIDVNLNAAYYCTHAVLPAMLEEQWGRIIFVTSPGGERMPMAGGSAYAAAKAGLNGMARCIAKEVVRRGVTVNSVMPGFVDTDMTRAPGEEGFAFMKSTWPIVPAESIAACVAFLTSDDAQHISGEEIGVWHGGPSFRP